MTFKISNYETSRTKGKSDSHLLKVTSRIVLLSKLLLCIHSDLKISYEIRILNFGHLSAGHRIFM